MRSINTRDYKWHIGLEEDSDEDRVDGALMTSKPSTSNIVASAHTSYTSSHTQEVAGINHLHSLPNGVEKV